MLTLSEQAAADLVANPLWEEALWLATTFQFHPNGEGPPTLGLVFGDWTRGVEIFRGWVEAVGHLDENDDLRLAVLRGDVAGQTPGYTLRLSATLDEYLDGDTDRSARVGQVNRMHPQSGSRGPGEEADLLGRFLREHEKHGEFMLAPIVEKDDERLWVATHRGIVKHELVVREASDVSDDDLDALAVRACDDAEVLRRAVERLGEEDDARA